ncbi:50S ribosomal protein L22 [Pleodorina starrii]|nr:50S ribosomal protein L22 [Pleodorina starrii]GLC71072.1 50S ribosomal protein L22 [Pleodorina starrii]
MAALRASLSHELLRPVAGPVRAMATFRPAVRPVRIAPTVSRKASTIVCSAATDAPAAAVAEPTVGEVKSGVAHLRFQRGSADKIRRVLDVIRGRSYEEALVLCEYMPYRACEKIIKCLMSAAANAKHNKGALKTKLYVSECFADEGPRLRRARPRAQGRAYQILKPTFHMTIKVEERQ